MEIGSGDDSQDDIQLSDDDEDDKDSIDINLQILTERKWTTFLSQFRSKPDTKRVNLLLLNSEFYSNGLILYLEYFGV